jgi:hypothetical protein
MVHEGVALPDLKDDIDERKKAEDALPQDQEELRRMSKEVQKNNDRLQLLLDLTVTCALMFLLPFVLAKNKPGSALLCRHPRWEHGPNQTCRTASR